MTFYRKSKPQIGVLRFGDNLWNSVYIWTILAMIARVLYRQSYTPDILLHPCVDLESTTRLKWKCEIITQFYHRPGISNKRNSTFCHPPFRSSCFPLYFWQTPWNSINFAIIFSRISINISREREREREDNGYFLEKTHLI